MPEEIAGKEELTFATLMQLKEKELSLSLLSKEETLKNKISSPLLNRPGLALAGFIDNFDDNRVQILGLTEIGYIKSLSSTKRYDVIKNIFSQFHIPGIIIANGQSPNRELVFLADEHNIALLQSRLSTEETFQKLDSFLREWFAPSKSIHATLVDVFGVGILITGQSGIGKSECGLDLVTRGHRLVADDVVKVKKKGNILIGSANPKLGHFMEIRGIGLIDLESMFGVKAVRLQKRIETQVELIPWRHNMDYERIGLKERFNRILDIEIPIIYLPVSPGKNISSIIEIIAMNHMLKVYGYSAPEAFDGRLKKEIERQNRTRGYLETDRE
jgi:HPr kinase/phosphorylase